MIYWQEGQFYTETFKATIKKDEWEYPTISYIHDKDLFEEIQLRVFNVNKEEIIYEELLFTQEQIIRLEEVNFYGCLREYDIGLVENYILNNSLPEGDNHPLILFQLKKENEYLKRELYRLKQIQTLES